MAFKPIHLVIIKHLLNSKLLKTCQFTFKRAISNSLYSYQTIHHIIPFSTKHLHCYNQALERFETKLSFKIQQVLNSYIHALKSRFKTIERLQINNGIVWSSRRSARHISQVYNLQGKRGDNGVNILNA